LSLAREILSASCKRVKIRNVVNMKGVEDYEPSYKGYKAVPQGEQSLFFAQKKTPYKIHRRPFSFLVTILTFSTN